MVLSATESEARVISLLMNPAQLDMRRLTRDKERPDQPTTVVLQRERQRARDREDEDHDRRQVDHKRRERDSERHERRERHERHGHRSERSERSERSDRSDDSGRSDESDHSDHNDHSGGHHAHRRKTHAEDNVRRRLPLTEEEIRVRDANDALRKKVIMHQIEMVKTVHGVSPAERIPSDATADDVEWTLSTLHKQVALQQRTTMVGLGLTTVTGVLVKLNAGLGSILNIDDLDKDVDAVVTTQQALLARVALELPDFNVGPIAQLAIVLCMAVHSCHKRNSAAAVAASKTIPTPEGEPQVGTDVDLPDLVTTNN